MEQWGDVAVSCTLVVRLRIVEESGQRRGPCVGAVETSIRGSLTVLSRPVREGIWIYDRLFRADFCTNHHLRVQGAPTASIE